MHPATYSAKAALLAGLAASSLASPVNRAHNNDQTASSFIISRAEDDGWCTYAEKLNTMENVEKALQGPTYGGVIEAFIRQQQNNDFQGWLGNLARYVTRKENKAIEGINKCALLNADCSVGEGWSCNAAVATNDGWVKEAWWVFKGVRGAHDKMAQLRRQLFEKVVVDGLKMKEIADEFQATWEDDSFDDVYVPEWLSTVLSVGSTLLGMSKTAAANPGIGVALGVVSTAVDFGMPEEEEPKEISLAGIESSLADMFEESAKGLDQVARIAVGKPWDGETADLLPNPTDSNWKSPIANFYHNPFWLLDTESEPVAKVIAATTEVLRLHVVDAIIQNLGYAIIWDPDVNKADCSGSTRVWLSNIGGKDRCFYLGARGDANYVEAPSDSELKTKMEKHGVELERYYKSSISCAKTTCKSATAIPAADFGGDADMPLCFYSAPVKKWDRHEETGCNVMDPLKSCQINSVPDFVDDDHKTGCPA